LVPFCGVPLLELALSQLQRLNLGPTAVNVSYQGDRVYEAARRLGSTLDMDIRISQENELLDHGGGLRKGLRILPEAGHLLVHNVDEILDFDLQRLVDQHLASGAAATLLMAPGRGPLTVDLHPDGGIADFRRARGQGQFTFAGIHIIRRDIFDFVPEDGPFSIIVAYEKAMAAGLRVQGLAVEPHCYWSDLGTPERYIRAHGDIADCALANHPRLREAQAEQARRRAEWEQRGVRCTGALGLGDGLSVPAGTHLHNVVLWDYTKLPRPVLYADGIFVGNDVPPPRPVDDARRPDPRIYASLNLDPTDTAFMPLQKQGSGRRYCRLHQGDRSLVWCAYSPDRQENAGFSAIADFLRRLDIQVPRVLLHLPDACELVSEDLGQYDLQRSQSADRLGLLRQVAAQAARLHVLGDKAVRLEELPLQRGFTKGLYDWERDYFRENLLDRFLDSPDLWALAAQEYCQLRRLLLEQPLVPIHRDLQSANVMVVEGKVYLIDFQGMRLGAAAYDMASLLYDPYQCHPRETRDEVWRHYCEQVRALDGTPPPDRMLAIGAVQRLFQALGAYGKLWLKDDLEWYRAFIVPGCRMLVQAAEDAGELPGVLALAKRCLELARKELAASGE
jgi:NDP-sugar pyrophosphorylase family protein/aminoglycoside/choline kinase family phosphotransferase